MGHWKIKVKVKGGLIYETMLPNALLKFPVAA